MKLLTRSFFYSAEGLHVAVLHPKHLRVLRVIPALYYYLLFYNNNLNY